MTQRAGPMHDPAAHPTSCGTLFLFEKLDDEQLDWLCERRPDRDVRARARCTARASRRPASTCCSTATLVLTRRVGGDDVEIDPHRRSAASYAGALAGLPRRPGAAGLQQLDAGDRAVAVLRAATPPIFAQMMRRVVPDGGAPAGGAVLRHPATRSAAIGQRERLLALGSLSAGLTHELNNPAAAAVRATAALRERVAGMRHKLARDRRRARSTRRRAGSADRAAGGGGRAGRQGADADAAGGLRPRGRARRLARGPRHRPTAGSSRRPSCRPGCDADWLERVADAGAPDGDPRGRGPLAQLHHRDRAADERDRTTPPPGSPRWSARPSSTRRWTGRRTRPSTCTNCSTARW